MKPLKWTLIVFSVIVLMMTYTGLASAILIASVDATVSPGPTYTYSYEVTNDISSDENIWAFSVYVGVPDTAIFDEAAPTGWDAWIAGGYLSFSSDPGFDITPDNSLSGFEFKSNAPPGTVPYEIEGADDFGFPTGSSSLGATSGPVPEPGTFLLLGVGLVGLAGYIRFRKKGK